jgi:hypothetical protein
MALPKISRLTDGLSGPSHNQHLLVRYLELIAGQLARLPTRRDLAKAVLGIIFATAGLVVLWAEAFWRL